MSKKYEVNLRPDQLNVLVSGEPLVLEVSPDVSVTLTLGDLAAVRLFKLMRETMNLTVKGLIEKGIADATEIGVGAISLRDLVREKLNNALENGYYSDLKQMSYKDVADDCYAQDADIETMVDARAPAGDIDGYLEREVVPIVVEWFQEQEAGSKS